MRILIAEDEVTIARVLKVMLEKNKYAVDMVHNGSDALDYIQAVGYDALVLDIMMPGKSGLEVLSEWTESIHHQIERLNSLVTQLLTLAKWRKVAENWS